jgi:hypothetical protein
MEVTQPQVRDRVEFELHFRSINAPQLGLWCYCSWYLNTHNVNFFLHLCDSVLVLHHTNDHLAASMK